MVLMMRKITKIFEKIWCWIYNTFILKNTDIDHEVDGGIIAVPDSEFEDKD